MPSARYCLTGAIIFGFAATADGIQTPTNAALSAGARTRAAQSEMLALESTSPSPPASVTLPDPTRRTAGSRATDQPIEMIPRRRGDARDGAVPQVSQNAF